MIPKRTVIPLRGTNQALQDVTPELWDSLIVATEHRGELSGHSLQDANHLVRSGQVERWQADVQIRNRSGQIRWVTDMSTVVRDHLGRCIGSLGVLLDITDRKEAERKLEELSERLRIRNEEIAAELAMAREVQQALIADLPDCFPKDVGRQQNRIVFHHRYIPAEMLAGDFFDILPLSENEVGVFISDVMGHGVRAALLTTFLRGLIEELTPYAHEPGKFLTKINEGLRAVFGQGENLLFASAFYLVLKLDMDEVRYANAGHPSPLCLLPEANQVLPLMDCEANNCGPALGIIDDFEYPTRTHTLSHSESLLLYTDGLFETYNDQDEMFGDERMVEALQQSLREPVGDRLDGLIRNVHGFSGSDLFEDDVCMVVVEPHWGT